MPKVIDKTNPGRVFEVIHGQLGAWQQGSAFTEYEFRRIHPAPKQVHEDEPVDVEAYYTAAFARLLNADGARPPIIREVADRKPDPTPLGPEANPPKVFQNPLVTATVKAVKEQLASESTPAVATPKK